MLPTCVFVYGYVLLAVVATRRHRHRLNQCVCIASRVVVLRGTKLKSNAFDSADVTT